MSDPRTDEELLAAVRGEPEAFAVFYRRHVRPLLGYFVRRTGDAERAADLFARRSTGSSASTPRTARRAPVGAAR